MHKVFFTIVSVLLFSVVNAQVTITQADPLLNILPHGRDIRPFTDTHPVAYGEALNVQLVLKTTTGIQTVKLRFTCATLPATSLAAIKFYREGFIKVTPKLYNASADKLVSASQQFPDPLFPATNFSLKRDSVMPVFIELPVTSAIKPGLHTVSVEAIDNTNKAVGRSTFSFEVYPVTVPKPAFNYVNWYHDVDYSLMNNGKPVQAFSAEYWKQFKKIVQVCRSYGQNTFTINPLYLITFKKTANGTEPDFTHFDKAVNIILNEVGMSYVVARHFALRLNGGWEDQFAMQIPVFWSDTQYMMVNKLVTDAEALNFYNRFIPAYYAHLKNTNVLNKFLQHLADEPVPANENSYKAIAQYIRKMAPGLKIIEAVYNTRLSDYIDVLVIQLGGELKDNYGQIKKIAADPKKQIWFYTAVHPQGNYANRFIELPLIKTRLLPWIAFRYNFTGYLHWGLNFWLNNAYDDASKIGLPGGDAYIIYPGFQSVVVSLRFVAMRNGINDIALLGLLKKKDAAAAEKLASQVIRNFEDYNTDTRSFMQVRKQILSMLVK